MIAFQTAVLRLALALGVLVGLERERGERTAGIRTHALVSLVSCLITIISAFGFSDRAAAHPAPGGSCQAW